VEAREAPFVVQAGGVQVRVVGTRFLVTRSAASVEVAVEHGEVEVVAGAEIRRLRAGEEASFSAASTERAPLAARAASEKSARDAVGELLAAADLARREGRAEEAVAALQALVQRHRRDPRAPSAAFSLGRVLLETQGRPREAAAAFARVAQLDPKSPLVEDALAREVEAWAKAGDSARAQAVARAYLARFPGSARAAFVRKHARLE
jgi:transmembrane sensor